MPQWPTAAWPEPVAVERCMGMGGADPSAGEQERAEPTVGRRWRAEGPWGIVATSEVETLT